MNKVQKAESRKTKANRQRGREAKRNTQTKTLLGILVSNKIILPAYLPPCLLALRAL